MSCIEVRILLRVHKMLMYVNLRERDGIGNGTFRNGLGTRATLVGMGWEKTWESDSERIPVHNSAPKCFDSICRPIHHMILLTKRLLNCVAVYETSHRHVTLLMYY